MTRGQWTVLVLLLALLAMEFLRSQSVRDFFKMIAPKQVQANTSFSSSDTTNGTNVNASVAPGNTLKQTATILQGKNI